MEMTSDKLSDSGRVSTIALAHVALSFDSPHEAPTAM